MITAVLAQSTVTDPAVAEDWYSRVLGRGPDTRPMDGLVEWHLLDASGVQVWSEPDRAGRSSITLADSDLDGLAARLREAGIDHDGPQPGGGARILQLSDPDGNRVVFTGP